MSVYPYEEKKALIVAAIRVISADNYQRESDPYLDAEQEYATEQLALAARTFAEAIGRLRPDERPIGWDKA